MEKEPRDAMYYLAKAGARVGPFYLGQPATTFQEISDVVGEYVSNNGYEQKQNVFVMGNQSGGPDLVDLFLASQYMMLFVRENKGTLEDAVADLSKKSASCQRLLTGINLDFVRAKIEEKK
jgi:hypothetical protein